MRIAITGASGHLGTSVTKLLGKKEYNLNILQYSQALHISANGGHVINGHINDEQALVKLLSGCDVVIHMAARVSINSNSDPSVYSTNFSGTKLLFDLSKKLGIKRFIYVSSIHAFNQSPRHLKLNESRRLCNHKAPRYDQSKRDAQEYVLNHSGTAMEVVVVNPTSIAGPPDHMPSLFGKAIIGLYHHRIPALIKGGFDFCDVRDVAQAVVNAISMGRHGQVYLLSGKWISMEEVNRIVMKHKNMSNHLIVLPAFTAYMGLPFICALAKITGNEPLFTHESVEALVNGNRNISSEKAMRELNYYCRPFTETVSDLFNWFEQHNMLK